MDELTNTIHLALRPSPVLADMPKDVLFASGIYVSPDNVSPLTSYQCPMQGDQNEIRSAVALTAKAQRSIIHTGGGVNSGPQASRLLREFVDFTGFPVTSTLMGLGAYPATGPNWPRMAGEHGSHQANMAIEDCHLLIAISAWFDNFHSSVADAYSTRSKKIHFDIDAMSINKHVAVDIGIQRDAPHAGGLDP